jgi:predicted methyltransferase
MKQKIGTILDSEIIEKAKIVAVKRRRPLSNIIEDAIRKYLEHHKEVKKIAVLKKRGDLSLKQVLSARGGEFADMAVSGRGSGDFDEQDFN